MQGVSNSRIATLAKKKNNKKKYMHKIQQTINVQIKQTQILSKHQPSVNYL